MNTSIQHYQKPIMLNMDPNYRREFDFCHKNIAYGVAMSVFWYEVTFHVPTLCTIQIQLWNTAMGFRMKMT